MKTKSIEKLREKLRDILRRGTKRQQNKLMKAYHGKRLNKWWAAYANAEGLTISQQKEFEGCSRHMKGGHHHRRNYSQCSQCAKWFRNNKGEHEVIEKLRVRVHFCSRLCSEAASSEVDWETGWPYEPHHVIEDDIIKEDE